jgi:hypothetical protein
LEEEEKKAEEANELLQKLKNCKLDGLEVDYLDECISKIDQQVEIIAEFHERKGELEAELRQISREE